MKPISVNAEFAMDGSFLGLAEHRRVPVSMVQSRRACFIVLRTRHEQNERLRELNIAEVRAKEVCRQSKAGGFEENAKAFLMAKHEREAFAATLEETT